jgi:putative ATP-binding cassette transporter
MRLLALFRRESDVSLARLMVIGGLAGVSNALVLAVINAAAQRASTQQHSTRMLVLFVLVMAIYVIGQRWVMLTSIREVEEILDRVRIRITDKVRRCDLHPIEEIGKTAIYSGVTKHTTMISHSALALVVGMQFAILIFFTAIYVAWLSMPAFLLVAVITFLLSMIHLKRRRLFNDQIQETTKQENHLFDTLTHLLEGFKEVRIHRPRSEDLYEHFEGVSHQTRDLKASVLAEMAVNFLLSTASFYFLLGVIVFVVPRVSTTYSTEVVKTTTAVLFLIGPISGLVSIIPNLAMADGACQNIAELEASLDKSVVRHSEGLERLVSFREISFEGVVFQYDDAKTGAPFTVGPIDFTMAMGEMVFIAGGNGSGKSTFLKLLTALYYPLRGTILLDGTPLTPRLYDSYRSLFSTVFTDYHLFDRLYGLRDVPQEEIDRLLRLAELTGKTHVVDGRFDTLELSGGQKKRLALVVSLLEKRPVCVFDEVGADQDPAFRRKFYKEILPALQQEGKTIVVVTHDDKYFDAADRLLKMDEGRFVTDDAANW